MTVDIISKPLYQIFTDLTQEPRIEVALWLAVKDWLRLRLKEARSAQEQFEQRYGLLFAGFKLAWEAGQVPDAYSYPVERDHWEWEATVTDMERLTQMWESLL